MPPLGYLLLATPNRKLLFFYIKLFMPYPFLTQLRRCVFVYHKKQNPRFICPKKCIKLTRDKTQKNGTKHVAYLYLRKQLSAKPVIT